MKPSQPSRRPKPSDPSSRRDFLRTAAALAAASGLAKAAFPAEPARAAATPPAAGAAPQDAAPKAAPRAKLDDGGVLKIALIGAGGMGNGHLDAFMGFRDHGREKCEIVAIADVCKTHLDPAVAKCSDKQKIKVDGYRNYHDLLSRGDIHGVVVATPEHWHTQMSIDAILAGKDVYCEKPMTLKFDDAFRIRKVVEANQQIMQVGTQYMLTPKYIEAKKLIDQGLLGHLTMSQTSYCRNSKAGEWLYDIDPAVKPGDLLDWEGWCGPLGPQPFDTEVFHRWRRYRRWSTGIVGDLLVHQMTPLVWAANLGWPVRVSAAGGQYVDKKMENHDQVHLTIEFENEHTMVVASSTCNETGLETMIRGHQANLYLGGNNCVLRPERVFADEVEEKKIECKGQNDQDELRIDWMKSIRTRQPNASPVAFACKVMVIVDLATRSLWEGKAWRFDPKSQTASPA